MPQLSSVSVLWDPATGLMQKKGVSELTKSIPIAASASPFSTTFGTRNPGLISYS
jgi:hypothetical protein